MERSGAEGPGVEARVRGPQPLGGTGSPWLEAGRGRRPRSPSSAQTRRGAAGTRRLPEAPASGPAPSGAALGGAAPGLSVVRRGGLRPRPAPPTAVGPAGPSPALSPPLAPWVPLTHPCARPSLCVPSVSPAPHRSPLHPAISGRNNGRGLRAGATREAFSHVAPPTLSPRPRPRPASPSPPHPILRGGDQPWSQGRAPPGGRRLPAPAPSAGC